MGRWANEIKSSLLERAIETGISLPRGTERSDRVFEISRDLRPSATCGRAQLAAERNKNDDWHPSQIAAVFWIVE
jgi:hypothetical protein